MVDSLILVLFVLSGAAAGWMGVHLLPPVVNETTDVEQLRVTLGQPVGLASSPVSCSNACASV